MWNKSSREGGGHVAISEHVMGNNLSKLSHRLGKEDIHSNSFYKASLILISKLEKKDYMKWI